MFTFASRLASLSPLSSLLILVAIVALLFTLRSGPSRGSKSGETVQLTFEAAELDLGAWPWGSSVPFSLVVQNRSLVDVLVESVAADCDCLVMNMAEWTGRSVPSGAKQTLQGRLDLGTIPGRIQRQIQLHTPAGTAVARVAVIVEPTFELSEPQLTFAVSDEDAVEAATDFVSDWGVSIESVATDVAWAEATTDGTTITVRVYPRTVAPPGEVGSVLISTNDPLVGETFLPLIVTKRSPVSFYPPQIFIRAGGRASVSVRDRNGAPLPIERAHPCDAIVAAQPGKPGTLWLDAVSQEPGETSVEVVGFDGAVGTLRVSVILWNSKGVRL